MNMVIEVTGCVDCPYREWQEDHSCSNNSGSSHCRKMDRRIERNVKYPKTPEWCPLRKV